VAVTCDALGGEIAVTESRRSAVHVMNAAGIETFVTGRFAGLTLPMDAAVDPEGRLVCLCKYFGVNNSIARLDVYGEPDPFVPETPGENWNPGHLLITRDGNYLTLDTDTGFLAKHDAGTGQLMWSKFLGEEIADANLGRPCELPSGDILVPGGRLFRVYVVSARGDYLEAFGRFGTAPGRMIFPVGASPGPDGTVLVLDRLRHKILVFDADYVFQSEFGSFGSRAGQFYHPVSMAADGKGSIYVAQGYKGRVQVFNVLGDRED
jgi:DNA-binding beta-propeller fold protein YncE